MSDIEERIAELLKRELKGNVPFAEYLAAVLVVELGLPAICGETIGGGEVRQLVLCTNCGKDPQEDDSNWCIACQMYVEPPLSNHELVAVREFIYRPWQSLALSLLRTLLRKDARLDNRSPQFFGES